MNNNDRTAELAFIVACSALALSLAAMTLTVIL